MSYLALAAWVITRCIYNKAHPFFEGYFRMVPEATDATNGTLCLYTLVALKNHYKDSNPLYDVMPPPPLRMAFARRSLRGLSALVTGSIK